MKEEIWKPIKEYEGMYEISNNGRIKSLNRINEKGRFIREKIMKTPKNGKYSVVSLSKNNKSKNYYVDKLLFEYFIKED